MRFYNKQGIPTQFVPLVGSAVINFQKSLKKYDDALYDQKLLAQQEPNLKAIVRNFAATPMLILLDPALKKEFAFQHNSYELIVPPGEIGKLAAEGLMSVKDEEWKKQRKIIGQAFHFELLRESMPNVINTAQKLVSEINQKSLEKVLILAEIEKIVGENVGRMFFGEEFQEHKIKGKSVTQHLMDTAVKLGKAFITPMCLIFGPKYIELGLFKSHRELLEDTKLMETTCQRMLEDMRNKDLKERNLAWYLIETQKNPSEEDRLSDRKIIANYITFMTVSVFMNVIFVY